MIEWKRLGVSASRCPALPAMSSLHEHAERCSAFEELGLQQAEYSARFVPSSELVLLLSDGGSVHRRLERARVALMLDGANQAQLPQERAISSRKLARYMRQGWTELNRSSRRPGARRLPKGGTRNWGRRGRPEGFGYRGADQLLPTVRP